MNNIFRSFLVFGEVAALGKVSLRAQFGWDWDMTNTCGAKPQGPKYPYPTGNGTYYEPGNCDVVAEMQYVYNYECSTNCLLDESKQITLKCNCLTQVGPIEIPIPCEWVYENDETCPEVPVEQHVDWECDPRNGTCEQNQYDLPHDPNAPMVGPGGWPMMPMMPFNPAMFNMTTTHGNATEMFQAGMPGYINHVYISPVMQQSIGDVDGDGSGTSSSNNSTDGSYGQSGHLSHSNVTATLIEYESKLAEEHEKTRGYKSKIQAAAASFKRERQQYENQLREKDQARQEILDQLHMLQSLIKSATHKEEEEEFEGNPRFMLHTESLADEAAREQFDEEEEEELEEIPEEEVEEIPEESVEESAPLTKQQKKKHRRQQKKLLRKQQQQQQSSSS